MGNAIFSFGFAQVTEVKHMQMSNNFGIMNCFVGNVLSFEPFQVNLVYLQENNKNFDKTL